jgi:16S rRNA (guanine966-N2)-methyltransferase
MKLRILSGDLGGLYLLIDKSSENFRPTSQQCREAVANMLRDRIEGARVGDFCAGSGAFGFEMLSRGARQTDFVENDRSRCREIDKNALRLRCSDRCRIYCDDIVRCMRKLEPGYEIIYYDPPYDIEALKTVIPELISLLSSDGILVYERRTIKSGSEGPVDAPRPFDTRRYGDSTLELFKREKA